jgi:hypothetical protein
MHKYMKMGKRNGKRKRKRNFSANWVEGKFRPSRAAGARAWAGGPAWPASGGRRRGRGPTIQREEGGGVTASGGGGGGPRR